jgi:hypothetical protein
MSLVPTILIECLELTCLALHLALSRLTDADVTKLHTQNTVNILGFEGRVTWHEHILSITSSTCTLRYFYAEDYKWRQMSRWGLHMQVAQPAYGPTRPFQGGRIHVKYPRAIPHPWITLVFCLKGGGWSHTDSWAHNEASNVTKMANTLHDI